MTERRADTRGRCPLAPTRRALHDHLLAGAKPREEHRIGIELEAMLVTRNGQRAPYRGVSGSLEAVLRDLAEAMGAEPVTERGRIVGAAGSSGKLSLEPGSQLEWASPPADSPAALDAGVRQWQAVRDRVLAEHGLRVCGRAYSDRPVERRHRSPKRRYTGMRRRYADRGDRALAPMHRTAGIHLSFDYASEGDWARKFRAMLWLTPLAVARFANSPGRWRGVSMAAVRPWLWHVFDPHRSQLPDGAYGHGFDMAAYARWASRRQPLLPRGYRGDEPSTPEGWLATLFPPVRSKQLLEVRLTDRVPDAQVASVVAYWHGRLGDEASLDRVLAACERFTTRRQWERLLLKCCRHGRRLGHGAGGPAGEAPERLLLEAAEA